MKCIIADDEYLVRYSITDMLQELDADGAVTISSITQAANGKELLEQVAAQQPDLAFVDIRMPVLDGLSAIEQGSVLSPHTSWIILTGYAEFDYAKKAISLGALDYLVKPASPGELERVVLQVQQILHEQRTQRQQELEHLLSGIIYNTGALQSGSAFASRWYFAGGLIVLDAFRSEVSEYDHHHEMIQQLRSFIGHRLPAEVIGGIAHLSDGNTVVVFAAAAAESAQSALGGLQRSMQESARQSGGLRYTQVAISSVSGSLPDLIAQLHRVSHLLYLRLVLGTGTVIPEEELFRPQDKQSVIEMLYRIITLQEQSPAASVIWLKEHRQILEQLCTNENLRVFLQLHLTTASEPSDPESCLQALERSLLMQSDLLPEAPEPAVANRLVAKALQLLTDRYSEEIGLSQIAEELRVTPNYLSSEFHRVTGQTFSHQLTLLRMESAERLLMSPLYTIKEISAMVGYGSSRHFNKVFKKYFGVSPTSYRQEHL
ncbi:MAG: response regulator [Spirochaetia bacterium]|nr:response regulator [Spirochaetia bacterium]